MGTPTTRHMETRRQPHGSSSWSRSMAAWLWQWGLFRGFDSCICCCYISGWRRAWHDTLPYGTLGSLRLELDSTT